MNSLKLSFRSTGWWLAAVGGLGLGCTQPGEGVPGGLMVRSSSDRARAATLTKEELHDKLDQFDDLFEAVVRRAADELVQVDDSRRVKRLTLIWQMRILPMARNALSQDNPIGGILDVWTLCIRMQQFLTTGDGKELFAPHQAIADAAARECVEEIEHIAASIMTPEMLAGTRERVQAVAAEHPFRGEFVGSDARASLQAGAKDQVLQSVLAIPLTPFRWLRGVDEGAQAIRGFSVVAARLTDVVEGLAGDARLQTQLLLLETEDLETVKRTVTSLERVSKSSERLAETAEKLPAELRRELTGLLDDVDARQAGIQETLAQLNELVDRLEPTGKAVAAAGESWAGTAKAIEEMVASFRKPGWTTSAGGAGDSHEPRKASVPYDINDYRRTAEALTQTAKELQGVIGDLRGLAESGPLTQRMDELSRSLDHVLSDSTDRAMWRALLVAFIVLVLALVYRIVAVHWIRSRAA